MTKQPLKQQRRSLIVLGSLVGLLTATSALLLALAPAPLAPEASGSLFAIDVPQSMVDKFLGVWLGSR